MTTQTEASPRSVTSAGDKTFAGVSVASGWIILLILAGVAFFLIWQALPAITAPPEDVRGGEGLLAYIGPLAFGTLLSAVLAIIVAIPLAVGISMFISHYAPRRMATVLGYVVDLLAAVPSVVYGLWGIIVLAPATVPVARWLNEYLGWIPFFSGDVSVTGRTMFTTVLVLAIMILPIMTATMREIFLQTPTLHEEGALALGATRWEMIKMTVLPFGRSGMVSGSMLGLGRALGETMAAALVLSPANIYTLQILTSQNPGTIAADIALNFPEASGLAVNTLIASGLVLFAITLAVNMIARYIISRRSEFSGAN